MCLLEVEKLLPFSFIVNDSEGFWSCLLLCSSVLLGWCWETCMRKVLLSDILLLVQSAGKVMGYGSCGRVFSSDCNGRLKSLYLKSKKCEGLEKCTLWVVGPVVISCYQILTGMRAKQILHLVHLSLCQTLPSFPYQKEWNTKRMLTTTGKWFLGQQRLMCSIPWFKCHHDITMTNNISGTSMFSDDVI